MSLWDLLPTCDDPMSVYTLVTFAAYSVVLLLVGKVASDRLDHQDCDIEKMTESMNEMQVNVAVMAESMKGIERDATETRTAIAEINRTLLDKLT